MSELFYDAGEPSTGKKVMLATTCYDKPSASYAFSMACTRQALHDAGWGSSYYLLQGNCHVDDARNATVRDFLESDCTDLVFIDADVSWKASDMVTLLSFDKDIVGGVYPYRRENEIDNMPVRALPDKFMEDGLIEVDGLPTGFLRLRREPLEKMAKYARKYQDRDDNPPTPMLFERDILGDGRRSGDIGFCMKWRERGGKIYAATDFVLGHTGSWVIKDSLAGFLRRKSGLTLKYMAEQIRAGNESIELFKEVRRYLKNPFAASEGVILTATLAARKADGPILEIGSGITTIAMAAATTHRVFCVEHDEIWARHVEQMAYEAGVTNIAVCTAPIKAGWYDQEEMEDLPKRFSVALLDGPPRTVASRMPFFERYGHKCGTIVIDDTDDPGYRNGIEAWCRKHGRKVEYVEPRCGVIMGESCTRSTKRKTKATAKSNGAKTGRKSRKAGS